MSHGEPLAVPTSFDTVGDVIAGMPLAFDPAAAGDLAATIQFDITDETPGDYHITIAKGTCTAYAGAHPEPTMTIHIPADVWLRIIRGELSGVTAFMSQKFKVSGSMDLLMRMPTLFKATSPS